MSPLQSWLPDFSNVVFSSSTLLISVLLSSIKAAPSSIMLMPGNKIALGSFNVHSEDTALCGNQVYEVRSSLCCGGKVYRDQGALFTCCGYMPCLTNVGLQVYYQLGGRLPDDGVLNTAAISAMMPPSPQQSSPVIKQRSAIPQEQQQQQAPVNTFWQQLVMNQLQPPQQPLYYDQIGQQSNYYAPQPGPVQTSFYLDEQESPLPNPDFDSTLVPSDSQNLPSYLQMPPEEVQYYGRMMTSVPRRANHNNYNNNNQNRNKASNPPPGRPSLFVIGGSQAGPIVRSIPNIVVAGGGLTLAKQDSNKYFVNS